MLLAYFLTVASFATAQIIPTTPDASFPACALTCAVLVSAQTICLPPQAAVTDQFVYDQCFCQSSLIASLYTTPDQVCTVECPAEADRELLQSWYTNFCALVAQTILPTEPGAASTSTSTSVQAVATVSATQVTDTVNPAPTTLLTSPTSQNVVVVTITATNSAPLVTPTSQPTSGASSVGGSSSSGSW
jgi:hypothetical protein